MEDQQRSVVVTGVSSGIGLATTKALLQRGYRVFGSVRTGADADRLASEIGPSFTPLLFDVKDADAILASVAQVSDAVGEGGLQGLVNNAGIVVGGPLLHLPAADLVRQFEVNVFGLMAVTQAFLPLLGAQRERRQPPGRIVNISSVSGHIAYPLLGPYAASKHALEALSDSLRRELMIYDIDVIVVVLGSVRTPIWEKVRRTDPAPLLATDYAPAVRRLQEMMGDDVAMGMSVEKASTVICRALEQPRPKPRYVVPYHWWTGWFLPRWLPTRLIDRLIARRLGLQKI